MFYGFRLSHIVLSYTFNLTDDTKYDTSSAESDQGRGSSEAGSFIGSPAVDPLIVKFGEGMRLY